MAGFDPNPDATDQDLPPRLRDAIARMHRVEVPVPVELDQTILADAKRSFLGRRRAWMLIGRLSIGIATAALVAIAVRVFVAAPSSHPPTAMVQPPKLYQIADVNHDGRVDILDAYIVARTIARHEPLDPAWDINGDGVVDQKDVDLIATLAVRAAREPPQ